MLRLTFSRFEIGFTTILTCTLLNCEEQFVTVSMIFSKVIVVVPVFARLDDGIENVPIPPAILTNTVCAVAVLLPERVYPIRYVPSAKPERLMVALSPAHIGVIKVIFGIDKTGIGRMVSETVSESRPQEFVIV